MFTGDRENLTDLQSAFINMEAFLMDAGFIVLGGNVPGLQPGQVINGQELANLLDLLGEPDVPFHPPVLLPNLEEESIKMSG